MARHGRLMGLEPKDLEYLAEARRKHPQGKSVAILGDCAFHFDNNFLFSTATGAVDEEWSDKPVSLESFGKALGFERVETLDVFGNPSIKADLNEPLPGELKQQFDWVLDAGTLFCVFDTASVFRAILDLLRPRGFVMHISALSGYLGRGYYCVQPALYQDFYETNEFELLDSAIRLKPDFLVTGTANRLRDRLRELQEKIGLRKPPEFNWESVPPGNNYLGEATRFRQTLRKDYSRPEPDMIPNNVLLLYFARRGELAEFRPALPPFYREKAAAEAK